MVVIRCSYIHPADGLLSEQVTMGSKCVVPFFRVFNLGGYEDRSHLNQLRFWGCMGMPLTHIRENQI